MAELTKRYIVMTMATEAPFDPTDPEGVFVLKPWKDPAALLALETYRECCYPELGRDLEAWIAAIRSGPAVRGDVGTRNEPYAKRRAGASGVAVRPVGMVAEPTPKRISVGRRSRKATRNPPSRGRASNRANPGTAARRHPTKSRRKKR
jgi:hypothetical protein